MPEIPNDNAAAPPQTALPALPSLPEPRQRRWQPLRTGLIELFHYDSEEFWFRDGHLLLRGNNGTGKSKVLSLTLPFLFDAQLKSSRIEPDGDAGKKMAWNLLLGKYERRIGYSWIEFGRIDDEGRAEYLTLGCGLAATAARASVDSWFFLIESRRHGRDFWLISTQRAVLTRDRLRDALDGCGRIFDTAAAYRRAVDERLFHLGEVRYGALMDTLIQLRQPQLSKRPNEDSLSDALTEALPPLSADLLGDVADAMSQLEEYRQQLAELSALRKAIEQFNRRYRVYAGIRARRAARILRGAQSGFEHASRDLGDAKAALGAAQQDERERKRLVEELSGSLLRDRAALEELQVDPVMRDARRLEETERNAAERQRDVLVAESALQIAAQRLQREIDTTRESAAQAERAQQALAAALAQSTHLAHSAGIADDHAQSALLFAEPRQLAQADPAQFRSAQQALRDLALRRRAHLAQLQKRLRLLESAEREHAQEQRQRNERADELEDAATQAAAAELAAGRCAAALLDGWQLHCDGLRQLQIADADAALAALADWVANLAGDNPARAALHRAQQQASRRLAERDAALRQQYRILDAERSDLQRERGRLERGEDKTPPVPYQRGADARQDRPGAPLWQLIEFRARVTEAQRAGLEAALEASGLLDAWVAPDGALLAAGTFDTLLVARAICPASLSYWLAPAEGTAVAAAVMMQLLRSIACAEQEVDSAEAWVTPSGQFRVGPVRGAWSKPAAEYIGFAAREAARRRRMLEVVAAIDAIDLPLTEVRRRQEEVVLQQQQAIDDWEQAPADDALRAAHVDAAGFEKQRRSAAEKLAQADVRLIAAERRWRDARESLAFDAADLRLPSAPDALLQIESALGEFESALQTLILDAQAVRHALPECDRQRHREAEARADAGQRTEHLAGCRSVAEEIAARLQVLRASVGARVGELMQRLAATRRTVLDGEKKLNTENVSLREAGEQRARSEQRVEDGTALLEERSVTRQRAIIDLQCFAATGLLTLALPDLELPGPGAQWTIDAALTLARRTEQALQEVQAEDADWTRIQNAVSTDYTELQRALTALGHQAQADTSDYGLIVAIVYQNRPQRPDLIEARIADEIAQRRELLTMREREVLENHLQAEVAAAVQRLLQESERRLSSINAELQKRPTSTGVRFRLLWQPLPEGSAGAPLGLEAARKRLLNTSADAWSVEDRKVVGDMLQNRIAAERVDADADGGGSLLDMLSRALDYRRWHRFRVQRWQDGQWRALSGPASSGERALGLTVPLFAAVSSFYSHGDYAYAPRLVLLDEAFAGIDDAARAHCMALVREFDLDFVMTSEREWACYAELPGVSICQLQRQEGIDAVYVSRWTWDGRSRRAEADGARRFPALA
ncbi:MAG: TIGR02680 family protein [Oxalobacteraceae bacterium]|nr:TIGR02680 family protein [Oxalobacteraceae bacterium]